MFIQFVFLSLVCETHKLTHHLPCSIFTVWKCRASINQYPIRVTCTHCWCERIWQSVLPFNTTTPYKNTKAVMICTTMDYLQSFKQGSRLRKLIFTPFKNANPKQKTCCLGAEEIKITALYTMGCWGKWLAVMKSIFDIWARKKKTWYVPVWL